MWVATRKALTAAGWVAAGRLVDDGDPMLEGAEPGVFVRVVPEGGDYPVVEEATAEPGKVRRTRRADG